MMGKMKAYKINEGVIVVAENIEVAINYLIGSVGVMADELESVVEIIGADTPINVRDVNGGGDKWVMLYDVMPDIKGVSIVSGSFLVWP